MFGGKLVGRRTLENWFSQEQDNSQANTTRGESVFRVATIDDLKSCFQPKILRCATNGKVWSIHRAREEKQAREAASEAQSADLETSVQLQ